MQICYGYPNCRVNWQIFPKNQPSSGNEPNRLEISAVATRQEVSGLATEFLDRAAVSSAIGMNNRLRSLGLRIVNEQMGWTGNEIVHGHRLSLDVPDRPNPERTSAVRLREWQRENRSLGSSDELAELFIGTPISPLHGFETFDIFQDYHLEIPVADENRADEAYAMLIAPAGLSNSSRVVIAMGSAGAFLYVLGHQQPNLDRTKQITQTAALAVFGPPIPVCSFLDETCPVVAKLST